MRRNRVSARVPELVLDLSDLSDLPAHLPRRLSCLEFPHRNADAYLRDAKLGGQDFIKTDLGRVQPLYVKTLLQAAWMIS